MKTRLITLLSLVYALLSAQSFDGGSWNSTTFQQYTLGEQSIWYLGSSIADPSVSYAAFLPDQIDTIDTYVFGLCSTQGVPSTTSDFDITGKNGSSGIVTLNFSGISDLDFIAYCGGELQAYQYDGNNLSIAFDASTLAESFSNTNTNITILGLVMVSGLDLGFDASVFRTNMFWEDIKLQEVGGNYGNTYKLPGANFNGTDGKEVTFDYYIKQSVLENLGYRPVTDLDKCEFTFRKSTGIDIKPEKQVYYFTTDGQKTDWGVDNQPSVSTLDFDGNGVDNYVRVHATNDSWSDANVCVCGQEVTNIDMLKPNITLFQKEGKLSFKLVNNNELIYRVRIHDFTGQLIFSIETLDHEVGVTLPEKGAYIISIKKENHYEHLKIVL